MHLSETLTEKGSLATVGQKQVFGSISLMKRHVIFGHHYTDMINSKEPQGYLDSG